MIFWTCFWTMFGQLWGPFLGSFAGSNGVHKWTFFGVVSGSSPEQSCEVSRTSWGSLGRPSVPNGMQKTYRNACLQKRSASSSELSWNASGSHLGSFWPDLGSQNGCQKSVETGPKHGPFFYRKNARTEPQNAPRTGSETSPKRVRNGARKWYEGRPGTQGGTRIGSELKIYLCMQ